ncbi:hypothetical protein ACE0DR_08365 [Azotobacter sp. CWF10]
MNMREASFARLPGMIPAPRRAQRDQTRRQLSKVLPSILFISTEPAACGGLPWS